jgi:hypothetical protein
MCGGSVVDLGPIHGTDENKILITLDLRTAQKTNKALSGSTLYGSSSASEEVSKSKLSSETAEPALVVAISWLIDAICNHRVPETLRKYTV